MDAKDLAWDMSSIASNTTKTIQQPPKPRYKLKVAAGVYFESPRKPNAWVRFWQWALLGWTWWERKES